MTGITGTPLPDLKETMRIHRITKGLIFMALASSAAFAQANNIKVPPVPTDVALPPENTVFLEGHATGTQNYICLPSGSGFAWTFFSPQATLFTDIKGFGADIRQQIITHFLSPNPEEKGTPRATWQSSFDSSEAWAKAIGTSRDPNFVAQGAIPWLLLQVVGTQRGPTQGGSLAATTYIQRLNTSGGVAPATGCSTSTDVGATALVPYTADYFFSTKASR
jgi:hypothetical protein